MTDPERDVSGMSTRRSRRDQGLFLVWFDAIGQGLDNDVNWINLVRLVRSEGWFLYHVKHLQVLLSGGLQIWNMMFRVWNMNVTCL